ncbi:MFS transporter [Streptomyces sp. SP17BM10]|uniref:MFS transporter n=1 Tax=Streptomyces sp. SP17BM10 TaxID=3002530 RepID=UPI002E7604CF|nr:MFS transporter [Streptomyces sp. SP17BM10]MEE1783233.1 MFS transporter [Streptomyces sp. SP17BM10]
MIMRRSGERVRSGARAGPERALIAAGFVNRVGNGLFNTAAVLYFTFVVHLPAAQVGAGLTIAGLCGLVAGVPAGNLADRYGPRAVWLTSLVLQAVTMAAFVLIDGWFAFALVATLDRLAATAGSAAGGALIARVGGERRPPSGPGSGPSSTSASSSAPWARPSPSSSTRAPPTPGSSSPTPPASPAPE